MNKLFTKAIGAALGLTMAIGVGVAVAGQQKGFREARAADVYSKVATATSSSVVSGTTYTSHSNEDWQITFGGNNASVGTNSGNRSKCNLSNFSKYAVSPVTTSSTASAFVAKTSLSNISKVIYTFNGGSNQTSTEVYLIYSSNDTTFSQVTLTTGTQGAAISSGTEFIFGESTGYFGLLFVATNSSGAWRIDNVTIDFYEKEATKTLSSISLSEGEGLKKDYVDGDAVDVEHIVATASYVEGGSSDVTNQCTITANIANVSMSTSQIVYSATYNGEEVIPAIEDLTVDVNVVELAVDSLAKSGTIKADFIENEPFSFGSGKIQVNYNNGTNIKLDFGAEGMSVTLAGKDVVGKTYYVQKADAGAEVVVTYASKTYVYNVETVSDSSTGEDGYYQRITSVSDLVINDTYIIVNEENSKALSTTQNTNNRAACDVVVADNKIQEPGSSEIFTLVEGTVEDPTTYGFKTHDNKYIYAASSSSNNLKTSTTFNENSSFSITFDGNNAVMTAQGSYTRNTIRYNTDSNLFSCYASSSTQAYVQLYHFVQEAKPADQVAVESFVDTYMHLDDVSINNHEDTNACRDTGAGAQSYYATAKAAYNDDNVLTADQRILFRTSEIFKIQRGYERLQAWATANDDTFNETTNKLESNSIVLGLESSSDTIMIIVVVVAAMSALSMVAFLTIKRRKHN